jgi:hypothetical protein
LLELLTIAGELSYHMRESCRNGVGGKAASQERHARSRKMTTNILTFDAWTVCGSVSTLSEYDDATAAAKAARVAETAYDAETEMAEAVYAEATAAAKAVRVQAIDAAWSVYSSEIVAAEAAAESVDAYNDAVASATERRLAARVAAWAAFDDSTAPAGAALDAAYAAAEAARDATRR